MCTVRCRKPHQPERKVDVPCKVTSKPRRNRGLTIVSVYCAVTVVLLVLTIGIGVVKEKNDSVYVSYVYDKVADALSWWILPPYLLLWKLPLWIKDCYIAFKNWLLDLLHSVAVCALEWLEYIAQQVFDFVVSVLRRIYHSDWFQSLLSFLSKCLDYLIEVQAILIKIAKDIAQRLEKLSLQLWDLTEPIREPLNLIISTTLSIITNVINSLLSLCSHVIKTLSHTHKHLHSHC